jgi:hypothetical protein
MNAEDVKNVCRLLYAHAALRRYPKPDPKGLKLLRSKFLELSLLGGLTALALTSVADACLREQK